MANYTMGLVTTQMRVLELKTPSNWVELNKMENVAVKQWKADNPAAVMTDDSIAVSVTDDAVRMSWALPANVCTGCGHHRDKHNNMGCLAPHPDDDGTYCPCTIRQDQIKVSSAT